jgi:hypothetical protein
MQGAEHRNSWKGVAGRRTVPQRWGGGCKAAADRGDFLPMKQTVFALPAGKGECVNVPNYAHPDMCFGNHVIGFDTWR